MPDAAAIPAAIRILFAAARPLASVVDRWTVDPEEGATAADHRDTLEAALDGFVAHDGLGGWHKQALLPRVSALPKQDRDREAKRERGQTVVSCWRHRDSRS